MAAGVRESLTPDAAESGGEGINGLAGWGDGAVCRGDGAVCQSVYTSQNHNHI
jgi:hypothetical protein